MNARAVAIKLDEEIRERFKRLGEVRDRSPHWLMVDAIKTYLEREERREAFHQEITTDYEQFKRDGLHVTEDEANAWLDQLAQGIDVEPPSCHA